MQQAVFVGGEDAEERVRDQPGTDPAELQPAAQLGFAQAGGGTGQG